MQGGVFRLGGEARGILQAVGEQYIRNLIKDADPRCHPTQRAMIEAAQPWIQVGRGLQGGSYEAAQHASRPRATHPCTHLCSEVAGRVNKSGPLRNSSSSRFTLRRAAAVAAGEQQEDHPNPCCHQVRTQQLKCFVSCCKNIVYHNPKHRVEAVRSDHMGAYRKAAFDNAVHEVYGTVHEHAFIGLTGNWG